MPHPPSFFHLVKKSEAVLFNVFKSAPAYSIIDVLDKKQAAQSKN